MLTYRSNAHHVSYIFEGISTKSSTPLFDDPDLLTLERVNGFLASTSASIVSDGVDAISTNVPFREGKTATGEHLAVYSDDNGHYLVTADSFSYQPVYYRFLPASQKLVVGTSPQALANTALNNGETNSPNWPQLLASVGTTHAWAITMQSNQTYEANTKVLLPGQHIQVTDSFWHISSANKFFEPKDDYDSLIERGIIRAIQQIKSASRLNVDQKRINLSGGKDSRMVLALLEAANVIDDFTVTTMNPRTWLPESSRPALFQDLYVANHLRKKYELSWTTPFHQQFVPLSFESSLNEWQKYRQHRNFKFRASNHLYAQDGLNIELRGAAGETFRGFKAVSGLMSRCSFENSPRSLGSDVELLTNHLYGEGPLNSEQRAKIYENFHSLFLELGAATIEDALHRRYTVFRNGSHFGHTRHSMSHGQIPVLPLSQPEFIQASQLLSPYQRNIGQVAFDIIERVNPELNEISFDSGYWSESLLPQSRRLDSSSIEKESPYLDQFFALDEVAIETRLSSKRRFMQKKNKPRPFDAKFETFNRIKQTLHTLNEVTAADSLFSSRFQLEILQGIESKKLAPNTILAKLDSLLLAITGGGKSTEVVVQPAASTAISLFLGRSTGNEVDFSGSDNQPHFQLPITLNRNSVEANVRLFGSISEPMEFKFSLFTDGKKVAQTEYSASQSATFTRPPSGKSRIQAFARYVSSPDFIFKFYSRYF